MRRVRETFIDEQIAVRLRRGVTDLLVEQLAHLVSDVAKDVYMKVGEGLPRSVYQMHLLNHLSQMGLTLESESSLLNRNASGNSEREIVVVDGRLAIECILEYGLNKQMQEVYRSRLGLDVKANAYELGLVVNFGIYASKPELHIH